MAQLGSDLQQQVQRLVLALGDITKAEREQLLERANQDCSRVREDMSQTLSIQHYLAALLAETDPFLLIWVRTPSKSVAARNRRSTVVRPRFIRELADDLPSISSFLRPFSQMTPSKAFVIEGSVFRGGVTTTVVLNY